MVTEKIPHVCASLFKWIEGVGTAECSKVFKEAKGFVSTFAMRSPLTGKIKIFDFCREESIENDSWDGEYAKYKTNCGLVAVIWNY